MHDHGSHPPAAPLPLSLLAQSAALRIGGVVAALVLLWLAIAWAIAQP